MNSDRYSQVVATLALCAVCIPLVAGCTDGTSEREPESRDAIETAALPVWTFDDDGLPGRCVADARRGWHRASGWPPHCGRPGTRAAAHRTRRQQCSVRRHGGSRIRSQPSGTEWRSQRNLARAGRHPPAGGRHSSRAGSTGSNWRWCGNWPKALRITMAAVIEEQIGGQAPATPGRPGRPWACLVAEHLGDAGRDARCR